MIQHSFQLQHMMEILTIKMEVLEEVLAPFGLLMVLIVL